MNRIVFFAVCIVFSCIIFSSCVTTPAEKVPQSEINDAKYTLNYNMGLSRLSSGEPSFSMEDFFEAEKYKKTPELYYAMGRACYNLNRNELALSYFDKALMLDGHFSSAYVGRGIVFMRLDRYQDAIKEFEKSLENILFHEPEMSYYYIGLCYYSLGDVPTAIKNIKISTQLRPKFFLAYFQLGKIYFQLNDLETAEGYFQDMLNYYPESPEGHLLLGKVYLEEGKKVAAEMEFKEVIRLAPDSDFSKDAEKYLSGGGN